MSHRQGGYDRRHGGPDRRRNRWGSREERPYPKVERKTVTEDDALQALLQSAQAREKERAKPIGKTELRRDDRPRQPRNPPHQQRLPENDSYYGPRGGEGNRNSTANHIEDEEASSKQHDKDNTTGDDDVDKPKPTHKPNFGLSGALAKDVGGGGGGVYKGVKLKFQEPPEARAPNTQWRFYVFKGKELLETLHISKQSAYLMGRNTDICDIPMQHPSLSSQHAVLQYRALPHKETGRLACQPYIMDLESTNGTHLNGVQIDPARYYQLRKGDVLKFGGSTREYVLLTENTTDVSNP